MLYGAVRAVLPKIKSGVAMNELGFMKSGGFVFELKLVRVTPAPFAIDAPWAAEGRIVGRHAAASRR